MHTTYNEYIKAYIKGQMNYKGVGSLSFPHCYVPSLRVCMWACSVLDHTAIALQNTIICNSSPYLYFVLLLRVGKKIEMKSIWKKNTTTYVAMCTEIDPKRLKRTVAEVLTTLLHSQTLKG